MKGRVLAMKHERMELRLTTGYGKQVDESSCKQQAVGGGRERREEASRESRIYRE